MKTATARNHIGTTVLANSPDGYRDERRFTRPIVLLSVDQLWTHEYRRHAPEGERTRINRAHPNVKPNKGNWHTGITGWLGLVAWDDRDNPVTPEELLAVAADLDASTFPDNAAKVTLPKRFKLTTVLPTTVHELPYAELWAKLDEKREHEARLREERGRAQEKARQEAGAALSHLREVTGILGVDEPAFFPPATTPTLPILRLLERLARAEGVELPPRPEHLRGQ